jgi:AcrR family transcriptional regulator
MRRPKKVSKSKPDKQLTHDEVMKASARVDPALRRRSQLLWEDRNQATRGPKAGFSPEEVVREAIAIADEEGLGAVTMNAVASKLRLTTMAVYRYFPSKEALLDAIIDAGMGPPPRPDPSQSWREQVAAWSLAKRAMLINRPWLAELPFVAAPHGPNWLMWLEALLEPISRTGIPFPDQGEMISIVDGFTRGASDTAISLARAQARGISPEQWAAAVGADLGRAIGDSRFPRFAALIMSPPQENTRTMEESFRFNLERVLDGIELYVKKAAR